jgi:DNA invertase Pin-like site-specific DNA recombinase
VRGPPPEGGLEQGGAPVTASGPRPVVLLRERSITRPASDNQALIRRVAECEEYAKARGWLPVGTWIDSGDVATTEDVRPQLDRALSYIPRMRRDADGRERDVILLVHSNDRFHNDAFWAAEIQRRISLAGARPVLLVENTDTHTCASLAAKAARR